MGSSRLCRARPSACPPQEGGGRLFLGLGAPGNGFLPGSWVSCLGFPVAGRRWLFPASCSPLATASG